MSTDFRVPPLSNSEVRKFAKKLREYFGMGASRHIDVLDCAKRSHIWTINGERKLNFVVKPDAEMLDDEAFTVEQNGTVSISTKRSVRYGTYMGMGRDRNTIAHEFGHAALGHTAFIPGVQLARSAKTSSSKWIKSYESAEHQVKVFAPAFLINDEIAESLASPEEIAVEFGVSLESATIYFEQLTERFSHAESAVRVKQIAREVRETLTPNANVLHAKFLDEACTVCSNRTLIPISTKFLCLTCDTVSDQFQDGDRTGD